MWQAIFISRYIEALHWKHHSKHICTILQFRTTFLLLCILAHFCFCNKNPQNIMFQTCNDFRRYVTWGKGNAWRNECRYNNTRANKKVRCKKAVRILCTPSDVCVMYLTLFNIIINGIGICYAFVEYIDICIMTSILTICSDWVELNRYKYVIKR